MFSPLVINIQFMIFFIMMAVSADIDMDNEYNMDDFVSTVNTVNIDDETLVFT